MSRKDKSSHPSRNRRKKLILPSPRTKSRGWVFPTKPFRPRFLSKASGGVARQTGGAQNQDLPRGRSCSSPHMLSVDTGGIQSRIQIGIQGRGGEIAASERWEHKHQQLRRTAGASAAPCSSSTPNFSLILHPQALTLQKNHSQTPRAFSNNSVRNLYIKRNKPAL